MMARLSPPPWLSSPCICFNESRRPMLKTARHRLLRRNRQQEKPKQTHHPQSSHQLVPPSIHIARLLRLRPELSSANSQSGEFHASPLTLQRKKASGSFFVPPTSFRRDFSRRKMNRDRRPTPSFAEFSTSGTVASPRSPTSLPTTNPTLCRNIRATTRLNAPPRNPICSPFVFMVLQIAFFPKALSFHKTSALPPRVYPFRLQNLECGGPSRPLSRCTNHFPFSPGARSRTIRRLCLVYPERRESSRSRHPKPPALQNFLPPGTPLQRRFCLQYTLRPGSSPHPALTQTFMDKRITSADAAIAKLQDGATILVGGLRPLWRPRAPQSTPCAAKAPKNLTIASNNAGTDGAGPRPAPAKSPRSKK